VELLLITACNVSQSRGKSILLQPGTLVNNVHILSGSEERSRVDDCARVRNDSFREDYFRVCGIQSRRERPDVGP
jgi:hypothetical protein